MSQPPAPEPPPTNGKYLTWLNTVKGLSLGNVLVIALLVVIAVPVYIIYKALGDEKLMDRFLSQYEEFGSIPAGCLLRHVQTRGGPDQWGISSGFAFQGADRWFISVVLPRKPTDEEIDSYCQSLKLITDQVLDRNRIGDDNVIQHQ